MSITVPVFGPKEITYGGKKIPASKKIYFEPTSQQDTVFVKLKGSSCLSNIYITNVEFEYTTHSMRVTMSAYGDVPGPEFIDILQAHSIVYEGTKFPILKVNDLNINIESRSSLKKFYGDVIILDCDTEIF